MTSVELSRVTARQSPTITRRHGATAETDRLHTWRADKDSTSSMAAYCAAKGAGVERASSVSLTDAVNSAAFGSLPIIVPPSPPRCFQLVSRPIVKARRSGPLICSVAAKVAKQSFFALKGFHLRFTLLRNVRER